MSPTAASVNVSGRVLAPRGRGLSNARVYLTSQSGETRTALTNALGYYRFTDVSRSDLYAECIVEKIRFHTAGYNRE